MKKSILCLVFCTLVTSLLSQTIPQPWQFSYIGHQSTANGSVSYENDQWTVLGGGYDIWEETDNFHFLYQEVCGDFSLTTKIISQEESGDWAKAGVMVRRSLDPESVHGIVLTFPANNNTGVGMQYRTQTGALTQTGIFTGGRQAPYWVRIIRKSDSLIGYHSPDGMSWTVAGRQTLPLGTSVYAGMAVTSFNRDTTGKVIFSNVNLEVDILAPTLNFVEAESVDSLPSSFSHYEEISASNGAAIKLPILDTQLDFPNPEYTWRQTFEVCNPDSFNIWMRVRNKISEVSSIWIKVDTLPWRLLNFTSNDTVWHWQTLIDDEENNPTFLGKGIHELAFSYAQGSLLLDRFLITDSLSFTPKGFGFTEIYGGAIYFSSNGDNSLLGTSPEQAWKSLDKLEEVQGGILPGTKILFERGGIFGGRIPASLSGIQDRRIVYGAYGTGNAPVISGALPLLDWERVEGHVYKAKIDKAPAHLWIDDKWLPIAREPDVGFWQMDAVWEGKGIISDSLNTFPNEYWEGAIARFKTNAWTWENRPILEHRGDSIFFESDTDFPLLKNWGFWLDGKKDFLDQPGEWAYEDGYLYLWFPDGNSPMNTKVEASIYPFGVESSNNLAYITIKDLAFNYQTKGGIQINGSGSEGVEIIGCEFHSIGEIGIEIYGKSHRIDSCVFENLLGQGIFGRGNQDIHISNNHFSHIGLQIGMGRSGQHQQTGIYLDNNENAYIGRNTLDSLGYAGINCYCQNSLVEENIISDPMLTLDDGGALYCWGPTSHHTIFRRNILSNVYGNKIGSPGVLGNSKGSIANAIYIDNGATFMTLEENTTFASQTGLLTNAGTHVTTFKNNVSYGNEIQLVFSDWLGGNRISDCYTTTNTLVCDAPNQAPMAVLSNTPFELGEFEENYYFDPYEDPPVFPSFLTYDDWKERLDEPNAKVSFFVLEEDEKSPSELYVNTSDSIQIIELKGNYVDIDNREIKELALQPYTSTVVFKADNLKPREEQSPPVVTPIEGLKIFPNPLLRGTNLKIESEKEVLEYFFLDYRGAKVRSDSIAAHQKVDLPLNEFTAGMYILGLSFVDGSTSYHKIVVH